MAENEILFGKRSVLKTTFIVFAGALALGLFTGKDGFNEMLFAIAFFALGVANVATLSMQVIISLRERYPEWENECFGEGGLNMYLTSAQKAALTKYMEQDEQAEQIKKEYAFANKISIVLLAVAVIVPIAAVVLQ